MKRLFSGCAALSLMLALVGCNNNPATGPGTTVTLHPDAGRFGISHLKGLAMARQNAAVESGENIRFDLGSIKGSTAFFFLLYNVGATPITNVTLSTGKNAFSVFPAEIDTLTPGSDLGMLPIVKIAAFHGTPFDGVGNRPLLAKGGNSFDLVIRGTTKTASGADTAVELTAKMDLTALIMDYSVGTASGPLSTYTGNPSLTGDTVLESILLSGIGTTVPCRSDSVIAFTNTGNVPLTLKIYSCRDSSDFPGRRAALPNPVDTVLESGAALQLSLPYDESLPSIIITIFGDNAVCDRSRIVLNDDGMAFMQIFATATDCIPGTTTDPWTRFCQEHVNEAENQTCGRLFIELDDSLIVFAKKCSDQSAEYGIYLSETGALLCKRSGPEGDPVECVNQYYSDLLLAIVQNLTGPKPDTKTLGLAQGRVGSGSYIGAPVFTTR